MRLTMSKMFAMVFLVTAGCGGTQQCAVQRWTPDLCRDTRAQMHRAEFLCSRYNNFYACEYEQAWTASCGCLFRREAGVR